MARRRLPKPHYLVNLGLSLAVLSVFALAGLQLNSQTSAATANPYGYADYCALENNTTVIYGWAADPNAGSLSGPSITINAGGQAVTTPTNRAGYRDAFVNSWIDQNRAGDPKPGSYGFRAPISGLYKGSRNTITGTVLNEGPGSSVILNINNNSYTDNDGTKPFFSGNVIPDACLATAPAGLTPPPPAPTPTPTPPAARPSGSGSGSSGSRGGAAAGPALSNLNDGSVTPGTLAASIKVSSGNATSIHIEYGKSPVKLDQSTADQPVSGPDATILLTGLDPSQAYSYQIVRSAGDKSATSPINKFDTLGFIIALHFVDNQNKGVQGIPATLSTQDKRKTSDDAGNVQFTNVPEGSHTVTYTYRDVHYTKLVTANSAIVSPAESGTANVVTIDYSINIEAAIKKTAEDDSAKSGSAAIWIIGLVLLAAAVIVSAVIIRRRKRATEDYYYDSPPPPLPQYTPSTSNPIAGPPPPRAEHAGESLKDMVLRSMHEEARRREDEK